MSALDASQLESELTQYRDLIRILEHEQASLVAAQMDALPEITRQKNDAVLQLTMTAQLRHAALQRQGYGEGEAAMKRWFDRCDATDSLHALWRSVLDCARQAKQLNKTNGLLLNRHAAMTAAALNVLRDASGTDLYDPSGQTSQMTRSRGCVVG